MKNRKEGQMSNEWEMVRLGDCTTITMGQSPESSSYNTENDGLPFYQGNADFGILNPTVRYYCNKPSKFAYYNDVLMSVRAPVGALNVANNDCCIGRGLCAISEKAGVSFYKYIFYNLLYNQPYIQSLGVGSTFKAISGKIVSNLSIPLPSIEKQREIAEVLDKASELVEKRKAQLAELDLLAESVFYDMFGDPVTNPKGWEFDCLKKHLKVIGGYAFKSTAYVEDGIPVLRIGNINSGVLKTVGIVFYEEHDSLSRYIVRPNDMVISLTGTVGKEDYGNICILDDTYSMYYLNQRNAKLDLNSTIDKWYLAFMLKNPQVKNKLTGISRGIRQANISNGDIENIIIPIAPIELQNQFAGIIEKIEEQKAKAKEALKESENLFQRLMQDMFNPDYHNS